MAEPSRILFSMVVWWISGDNQYLADGEATDTSLREDFRLRLVPRWQAVGQQSGQNLEPCCT